MSVKYYQLKPELKYYCHLKTRAEMEANIKPDMLGWWHDVCPGRVLELRQALASDLAEKWIRKAGSRNPDDYMIELIQNGSLVHKDAIKKFSTEDTRPLSKKDMQNKLNDLRKSLESSEVSA